MGGYEQTAILALNTKIQLHGRSKVFAVWDADVFTDTIPNNSRIEDFYNRNRADIYNLGCTPEVWMVEQLESLQPEIVSKLRERFHYEVSSILTSSEYMACNSTKPRKLAKQKMDVIVEKFASASGDSKEIVLDVLAQIIIDNTYTEGEIRRIIAPMLSQVQ